MLRLGFGRIIYYCTSVAALTGGVVGLHYGYASSKSALHWMLYYLAIQYANGGLTFNAIAPALIEDIAMLRTGSDGLRAKIPVSRLGKPDEIASVLQLIVENGYLSNTVWSVDEGWRSS